MLWNFNRRIIEEVMPVDIDQLISRITLYLVCFLFLYFIAWLSPLLFCILYLLKFFSSIKRSVFPLCLYAVWVEVCSITLGRSFHDHSSLKVKATRGTESILCTVLGGPNPWHHGHPPPNIGGLSRITRMPYVTLGGPNSVHHGHPPKIEGLSGI